jgi:hypothetical protein
MPDELKYMVIAVTGWNGKPKVIAYKSNLDSCVYAMQKASKKIGKLWVEDIDHNVVNVECGTTFPYMKPSDSTFLLNEMVFMVDGKDVYYGIDEGFYSDYSTTSSVRKFKSKGLLFKGTLKDVAGDWLATDYYGMAYKGGNLLYVPDFPYQGWDGTLVKKVIEESKQRELRAVVKKPK